MSLLVQSSLQVSEHVTMGYVKKIILPVAKCYLAATLVLQAVTAFPLMTRTVK